MRQSILDMKQSQIETTRISEQQKHENKGDSREKNEIEIVDS